MKNSTKQNTNRNTITPTMVVHRVIRMERNAVERNAVGVFFLLDLDAVGIVGTDFMQGQDVQDDEEYQH